MQEIDEKKPRTRWLMSILCILGGNRKIDKFARGGVLAIIVYVLLNMMENQNKRISNGFEKLAGSIDNLAEKLSQHQRDDIITELALKLQDIEPIRSKRSTTAPVKK